MLDRMVYIGVWLIGWGCLCNPWISFGKLTSELDTVGTEEKTLKCNSLTYFFSLNSSAISIYKTFENITIYPNNIFKYIHIHKCSHLNATVWHTFSASIVLPNPYPIVYISDIYLIFKNYHNTFIVYPRFIKMYENIHLFTNKKSNGLTLFFSIDRFSISIPNIWQISKCMHIISIYIHIYKYPHQNATERNSSYTFHS